jgi:hypothetical protein
MRTRMRCSRDVVGMATGEISALEAHQLPGRARWESLAAGRGLVPREALF